MVELTLKKIPLNSPPVPPWILSLGLRWATLGFRKFGGSTKGQMTMTLSLRRQHCLVRKYSIHEDHESKQSKHFDFFFFTFLSVLDILSNSLNLYVLSFSVFFRFTEMYGNFFVVSTLSTVGIQWESTCLHQYYFFSFGQIKHTSY